MPSPSIAIVGAGISGLWTAKFLKTFGEVVLFDKGRGIGGRVATRRRTVEVAADAGQPVTLHFDHGCPAFTADNAEDEKSIRIFAGADRLAEWTGTFGTLSRGRFTADADPAEMPPRTRWVGVPGMTGLTKGRAEPLTIHSGTRIESIEREENHWRLVVQGEPLPTRFDLVLLTAPAPQTRDLWPASLPHPVDFNAVRYAPCWTGLFAFSESLRQPFAMAEVSESPITKVMNSSSKPQREPLPECWVVHAGPEWSQEHLEADPEAITPLLQNAFGEALGIDLPDPIFADSHRWRYSQVTQPLPSGAYFDEEQGIGFAGDWCKGPTILDAIGSGSRVMLKAAAALKKRS